MFRWFRSDCFGGSGCSGGFVPAVPVVPVVSFQWFRSGGSGGFVPVFLVLVHTQQYARRKGEARNTKISTRYIRGFPFVWFEGCGYFSSEI